MTFEKEYPSFKKFGKTHRQVLVGNTCRSEPMWSQSVIESCCFDKERTREIINAYCFPPKKIADYGKELTPVSREITLCVLKSVGEALKKELGL